MRYKSDGSEKSQEPTTMEDMPVTCGSFNSALLPPNYGNWMNTTSYRPVTPSAMPASYPAPTMPTGYPTGPTTMPLIPSAAGTPATIPGPGAQIVPGTLAQAQTQVPVTVESPMYTPGFLRTQIGKKMRVEFLIGTNGFTDRTGTLLAVGASYILLRLIDSDDVMMCDIYSIKFVTIIV